MPSPSPNANALPAASFDLQRVSRLFVAPQRISRSGFLRREISLRMQERLELVKLSPQEVLDAGCGEGDDLRALNRRYPAARMTGVDISAAMLAATRVSIESGKPAWQRLIGKWLPVKAGRNPRLLHSDFAGMPLMGNAVDLLWSNLALHWHPQPLQVFAEWQRVLRANGLLMFSCFGPDTFRELRQAFATADDYSHTLPFTDMHDLGDMLLAAGFSEPVMDMEKITVTYESVGDLIADVRAFGGNPLAARRRGLLGRESGKRLMQALEAMRGGNGKIPLTFEVIYGHAFKPVPTTTEQGEAIVRFVLRR